MNTQKEQVRDFAFCYFGLLQGRNRLERIAGLLPAARRQKVLDCVRSLADLSPRELADGLRHLRESAAAAELQHAGSFDGLQVGNLSPALRRWFCARPQELHDGREDHKG